MYFCFGSASLSYFNFVHSCIEVNSVLRIYEAAVSSLAEHPLAFDHDALAGQNSFPQPFTAHFPKERFHIFTIKPRCPWEFPTL